MIEPKKILCSHCKIPKLIHSYPSTAQANKKYPRCTDCNRMYNKRRPSKRFNADMGHRFEDFAVGKGYFTKGEMK
jgi:hypothetical protein